AGDDTPAIGRERHREHALVVPDETAHEASRGDIPKHDAAVARTRDELLAVGRKGEARDEAAMPTLEQRDLLALGRITEPDLALNAARGDELEVRRDGDGVDAALVPPQHCQLARASHIPDAQRQVVAARDEMLALAVEERSLHHVLRVAFKRRYGLSG